MTLAARLPPPGIVGLNPEWSRLVTAYDHTGQAHTWHLLDNGEDEPHLTLLCVHGNPSWSFLWRELLAQAPPGVRVIAVDQLDMGFSERTGTRRRLADRIEDLARLTDALGLDGSVVTVAHDWGGPISLGWAQRREAEMPGSLRGIVLTNTAVHQPDGSPAPAVIRAARTPGVLRRLTVTTPGFIHGAMAMSRPRLDTDVRQGFLAPYATAARRAAIADFVEDIPLDSAHPSHAALESVADGLADMADVPALLLWGPADPVFSDLYLHDLERRLPHADVHRFVGASHFVPEDADVAGAVLAWLSPTTATDHGPVPNGAPLWDAIDRRALSDDAAVVELHGDARSTISFGELQQRVARLSAGLVGAGVMPGERVALMIPPGIDLTVTLYACWRMGAVTVLIDSGLGARNMSRAVASAAPDHLIGVTPALAAAKAMRWPGRRISVRELPRWQRRSLGVRCSLTELEAAGASREVPAPPRDQDDAAVVFTSGSTGPSKGVVYRHHQLQAQRDQLADLYAIGSDDRLVAAFAPFALYGPALGITSAVPDMDVARPGTLDAPALGAAVVAVEATLVFASPAALENVIATRSRLAAAHHQAIGGVRLVLSAGAPINPDLLARTGDLMPNAEPHSPYGMTEVLPVADITLAELRGRGGLHGACVGRPVPGVDVRIDAAGEVLIRAAHLKDHYDRLWFTERRATTPDGWHRSGDSGHIDDDGYLWISGRVGHELTAPSGVIHPVGLEVAAEGVAGVKRAAAVGVGPTGCQVIVIVAETADAPRRGGLAPTPLADAVRAAVAERGTGRVAAVLTMRALPVDRRHNSKIDRRRVAGWADGVLAGDRWARP